jgi:AraC-like DNA-binding protein
MRKYFRHKIKSLLVVNKIISLHFLEPDSPVIHQDLEHHDFWEIVFVLKGSAECTQADRPFTLEEGNIVFHRPNCTHSLKCGANSEVFVASFECLSESIGFFSDKMVALSQKQISFIKEIIDIAKKTYDITFYNSDVEIMNLLPQPTLGGEQLVKNYLEMLLIDLMRTLTETESGNSVFLQETEINNKLAEDIIKILKSNIYNRLSIEEISRKISYSKAYVFRQFKLATNKSVMEYFTDLKISVAEELIRENELSIKEISDKLAFDSPNYFTKTFKKITGVTPTAYKKRISK